MGGVWRCLLKPAKRWMFAQGTRFTRESIDYHVNKYVSCLFRVQPGLQNSHNAKRSQLPRARIEERTSTLERGQAWQGGKLFIVARELVHAFWRVAAPFGQRSHTRRLKVELPGVLCHCRVARRTAKRWRAWLLCVGLNGAPYIRRLLLSRADPTVPVQPAKASQAFIGISYVYLSHGCPSALPCTNNTPYLFSLSPA